MSYIETVIKLVFEFTGKYISDREALQILDIRDTYRCEARQLKPAIGRTLDGKSLNPIVQDADI